MLYRLKLGEQRLRRLFFDGPWAADRWVCRPAAQEMLERALAGAGDPLLWQPVWRIATLEAWLRTVLGYYSPARRIG
jgi:hypothetical protein